MTKMIPKKKTEYTDEYYEKLDKTSTYLIIGNACLIITNIIKIIKALF